MESKTRKRRQGPRRNLATAWQGMRAPAGDAMTLPRLSCIKAGRGVEGGGGAAISAQHKQAA